MRLSAALIGLVREESRTSCALELARLLECERVLVYVAEPRTGATSPLAGLPWPHPQTADWKRLLEDVCKERLVAKVVARHPETGAFAPAIAVRASDGTILAVFGGTPRLSRVRSLRPLLSALGPAIYANAAPRSIVDLEAEITRLNSVIQETGRIKDDFLASLSHELRTPLNAMLGWIQLLRVTIDDPVERSHALEVIERNARAQIQLVADLLDVSRVITGKMRLTFQRVNLDDIVSHGVESLIPTARAKNVDLRCALEQITGALYGDPARLQQVVWNLVSNAVKFTPSGGTVRVRLRAYVSNAEISVADTGIGIRADVLPHVFDRFRQGDSSLTRSFGGLGLGLAIVRHLVELHGGTVEAQSGGPSKGATFIARLPLGPHEVRSEPSAEASTTTRS